MTFIVIIPARLASTRLPGKPLADLGGKPMIVRVAERSTLSGARQVIVATDHPDIFAACQQHGVDVCMTRTDHASGTDRIAEVAEKMKLALDMTIVNVQGDEPLIDPNLIHATAALINASVSMATAAHPITDIDDLLNPNVVKVALDAASRALYFSRAPIPWHRDYFSSGGASHLHQHRDFPSSYKPLRHIGLYAYRNDLLQRYPTLAPSPLEQIEALEQLRILWHGLPIAVHVIEGMPAAGVDTPEDLLRARAFFKAADN